jgi:hypothetical protein
MLIGCDLVKTSHEHSVSFATTEPVGVANAGQNVHGIGSIRTSTR